MIIEHDIRYEGAKILLGIAVENAVFDLVTSEAGKGDIQVYFGRLFGKK